LADTTSTVTRIRTPLNENILVSDFCCSHRTAERPYAVLWSQRRGAVRILVELLQRLLLTGSHRIPVVEWVSVNSPKIPNHSAPAAPRPHVHQLRGAGRRSD